MPGSLTGPQTAGYGTGNDIWVILAGHQDELDAIHSADAATVSAMPPAATDLASALTLLNYLRSRALLQP